MSDNSRKLPCWIDGFIEYTDGLVTPKIFRLWSAIATVSGLLERRVYTFTAGAALFPNVYVMLVSPPGVGKTMVLNKVRDFWIAAKVIHVAPNNMTKAGLVDVLGESHNTHMLSATEILDYHGLQICASEFGVFCPSHDLEFLSVLSDIYDNPPMYREARRSMKGKQAEVSNPQLTIVAGTQPDYLAQFLPEAAWGQGFMTRVIMIYSDEAIDVELFGDTHIDETVKDKLKDDLKHILNCKGYIGWSDGAKRTMEEWYTGRKSAAPEHFKLKNYNTRRHMQVLKLSIISSVSRNSSLVIEAEDVVRAIGWLIESEQYMPEVFKAMKGTSDHNILQELKMFVASEYVRTGGKEIPESMLISFLHQRTPVGNIPRMIESAQKGGLITQVMLPKYTAYRPGLDDLPPET